MIHTSFLGQRSKAMSRPSGETDGELTQLSLPRSVFGRAPVVVVTLISEWVFGSRGLERQA
jgi:hypothetical protein